MSSASLNQTVLSVSTATPTVSSCGSETNLEFAPRKSRYHDTIRCRSRKRFGGVKINLFDSLAYDVCGDGQTESPPSAMSV